MADEPNPNPNPNPEPPAPPPPQPAMTKEEIAALIDDRFNAIMAKIQPQPAVPAAPGSNGTGVLDSIAEELAREEGIDIKIAKGFVSKFEKIHKHLSEGDKKPIVDELNNFKLRDRLVQVFAGKPDAEVKSVSPKMTEIYKSLSDMERNFVLNSPDGGQYLYDKAKRAVEMFSQPASVLAAASAPPGRSPSSSVRLGSKAELYEKANKALTGGNKAEYESIMEQIRRG